MVLTEQTFLHAFQKQVICTPDHHALSDVTNVPITYRKTQQYANYVYRKLTESGVGRGDIVALFLGRTAFFPIAAIGVFQAGAAYMPIDPRYPDSRIAFMLEDSEAKVLITSRDLAVHTQGFCGTVLYAEDLWVEEEATPEPVIDGEDMDYVIYTSGTTGRPKGAVNMHKGLMNLIDGYAAELGFNEDAVSGVYASFGFDASVLQIFPFLARGARVDIIPTEVMLDMRALSRYTNEHGITTMYLPPSIITFFDSFCENTTLKSVVAGGDRLTYGPGRNFVLYNLYGPTEVSAVSTLFLVDKKYDHYPIGKVIKNNCGYIVDEHMQLLPDGEAGELCIAGIQVGAGYLKQPELSAEKFIANPFSDEAGYETIYRTGDLCRVLPDGNYAFLGRIDTQVKIRGFRIELGEIEMTMRKYDGVKEAVCTAFEDEVRGEKYIVGYYTADEVLEEGALQAYVSQSLPYYMVPAVFVKVETIPVNANGKYDRNALAKPVRGERGEVSCAETPEEQVLVECLGEIVGTRQLDFEHNFSEAGGDSLGAIQLITLLIEKKYTIEIAAIINPEHTLRDIARLLVPHVASIEKKPAGVWEKPVEWSDEQFNRVLAQYGRENIERIYDLTCLQTAFLHFCLTHPERETLHIQNSYTVQGPLDSDLCCAAFAITVRKHPVLQTAIVYRDVPVPKQLIVSNRGLEMSIMSDEPIDRVVKQELRRGFDFEKDNLIRIILLKEGTNYTHIIISVHHIVIDGWGLGIFMRDFTKTYQELAKGVPITLLKEKIAQKRNDAFSYEELINYVNGLDQDAALAYFSKKIAGHTATVDLIHDYPNPQGNWSCSLELLDIPYPVSEGIRSVARQYRVSVAAIYEGVFAVLLQNESGSSDVVFSLLLNERWYPVNGIADILGFLVSKIGRRVIIDTDTRFADLFTLVQKQSMDDLKYSYVDPFEVGKLFKARTVFSYNQFFYQFALADDVSVSFDMEYHTTYLSDNEDILFNIEAMDTAARLRIEYNTYNYSKHTIKRFLHNYLSVLEYITAHINAKIREVPVDSARAV
ncbi:MAG: amino acid adenylation domain-containing protein [Treponema sp.]|jgi:amino acid adenylation domain-containing protein|nr:amino acid adenylation domain-containing protein [Treponema sp.]